MAGEDLASAARMVAMMPSILYFHCVSMRRQGLNGRVIVDNAVMVVRERVRPTQQTPAMPYLPFAAFSSIMLALF
jgi:hypothetical protein